MISFSRYDNDYSDILDQSTYDILQLKDLTHCPIAMINGNVVYAIK